MKSAPSLQRGQAGNVGVSVGYAMHHSVTNRCRLLQLWLDLGRLVGWRRRRQAYRYNWQFGSFVYGLGADASWLSNKRTEFNTWDQWRWKMQWLATFRARAGLAVDRTLLYLTTDLRSRRPRTTGATVLARQSVILAMRRPARRGWAGWSTPVSNMPRCPGRAGRSDPRSCRSLLTGGAARQRGAACAIFKSAGEISTPKRSHQMMTLGYFARSTPAGIA